MAIRSPPTLPEKIITALYKRDYKTRKKDYETLKRFLNKDTINLRDAEDGRTLLMLAAAATDADPEMIQFLIDNGADVNLADSGQYTALHCAAGDLRKDIVQILLAAGADANAQDDSGWTPLHLVVRAPDPKGFLVDDLVRSGADPNRKDASGASPKQVAEEYGQSDLFRAVKLPKGLFGAVIRPKGKQKRKGRGKRR